MRRTGLAISLALVLSACAAEEPTAVEEKTAPSERVESGNMVLENVPEIPTQISERLIQYGNARSASFVDWRPDGAGMLIATRFGNVTQLHRVEGPGAARAQVTYFAEPVRGASYRPGDHAPGFVFGRDVGGSEDFQLFYYDEGSGEYTLLSDGNSRNGSPVWANSGDRLAFYSTRRDGQNWDIYSVTPGGFGTAELIMEAEGAWTPVEFSPDDSKLLVSHLISSFASEIYVRDLASGEMTPVRAGEGAAVHRGARFSKDGGSVYFISDHGGEFRTLRRFNLADGSIENLTGSTSWDVSGYDLSPDGAKLAYAINADGLSEVRIVDLETNQTSVADLPVGVIFGLAFSPDSASIALTMNRATAPSDVYVMSAEGGGLTRWTMSEVGGLDTGSFADASLIHYPTFDEVEGVARQIPGFIQKPAGDGPHPVIINIHGGPEGQARPSFSSISQYWTTDLGFAVIRPNVRGSSGYGKSYMALDNGFKRKDSVADIGALLDWIEAEPDLDGERVVVYGGSYGGYMVLAAMVDYNDRLLGGVDIVGLSNFVTFLENTRPYRRDLRRPEYGDERDPEMRAFQEEIAPANNADEISRPLFVIQGFNDPRVPYTESEQMVATIRESGSPVWYMMAKDEGHGFRKKANRDQMNAAVAMFLKSLLHSSGATPAAGGN